MLAKNCLKKTLQSSNLCISTLYWTFNVRTYNVFLSAALHQRSLGSFNVKISNKTNKTFYAPTFLQFYAFSNMFWLSFYDRTFLAL